MFSKKIALALGLPEGASEDECLSAISAPVPPVQDDKLSAAVEVLKKSNDDLKASLDAEKKLRRTEFLSTVKQRAVDLGTPLEDEQVKKVEGLLESGLDDAAKTVADSFLSVCAMKSTKPLRAARVPHTEGDVGKGKTQTDAEKKQKSENELLSSKRQLESMGFKVKIENGELVTLSAPSLD